MSQKLAPNGIFITSDLITHKVFNRFIDYSKVLRKKKFNIRAIPGIGIICAIISVIFWSTAGLCIKLSDDVHALEVLTIRCSLGTVSMACLYSSYRLIPLSDATTIRFTAPLFVSLFAFLLLAEPFGPIHMLSAGITITGVLLVGRPTFLFNSSEIMSNDKLIGLGLALAAAISIAISMTAMRKLQKTGAPVVIFWFSMATVLFGLISLWILDEFKWPSNATIWLIIVLTGLCGASDQIFITMALKLEHAGPIAMVQALNVVISFVFSFTILNEKIRITSFIGGALIFLSICIMSAYKWYHDSNNKEPESTDKCCDKHTAPVYVIHPIGPTDPNILSYLEWNQNKTQQMFKI